jgi:hypothetical protein
MCGGLLGAALCFLLVFMTGVNWWPLYLAVPFGAVAGLWKGDHALLVMLRALGRL